MRPGDDPRLSLTIDNLDTEFIGGASLDKVTVSGATGGVTLNTLTGGLLDGGDQILNNDTITGQGGFDSIINA